MKKIGIALMSLLMLLGLAACSSNASSTGSSNDNTQAQDNNDDADSSQTQASSSDSDNGLTQASIYTALQNAGYTGLSKFNTNYEGLSDAVQSQSMNYVVIGKVADVAAVEAANPALKSANISIHQGQWVFWTNYKVGTLSSMDSLKNIQ